MADLKRPPKSEMCPPGYHVVRGHARVCESGTTTWVDAHIRKNRGKIRPGLLKENIYYLFWNSNKSYDSLPTVTGFGSSGAEFDKAIQFWLDYWKSVGIPFPSKLDPLLVKCIIALESSFNPKAKTKSKNSTASGLMQVTDQSMRIMAGFPNKNKWIEIKNNLIHLNNVDEKLDALISIALGTRWLGHKFSQIPKSRNKDLRSMVVGYHSFDAQGELYADNVFKLYEKSRKNSK